MLQSIIVRDKTVKDQTVDYEGLITEYFNENHRGVLIFNGGVSTTEIYGPLKGRLELDTGHFYIPSQSFNHFLVQTCKVSTDEMEQVLTSKGVFLGIVEKKRLSTGWKGGTLNGIKCYSFKIDTSKEQMEKLIAEARARSVTEGT